MAGKSDKYAVIGDPVAHSLSPVMHNAAFSSLGINARYSAVHVRKDELSDFARDARKNLRGFNITVPHKGAVIPYLDSMSDQCRLSASVNTVVVRDGKLHGESTDGYGLEKSIEETFGIPAEGHSFLFLGCGGAANAVAFHFVSKKPASVMFANRTLEKAQYLASALERTGIQTDIQCCRLDDFAGLSRFIGSADVIIQATSLGLKDSDPSPVPAGLLNPQCRIYDTIYRNTALLKMARNMGCECADGRGMLLHQGARSFELWTGREAPLEVMRSALDEAIARTY